MCDHSNERYRAVLLSSAVFVDETLHKLYLPTFLSQRHEIFILREPGFFVENPIISKVAEDFSSHSKEFQSS